MRSKTSFFNKTIYKKNLTRFAPVWVVYALGLAMFMLLHYTSGGSAKNFHFANDFIHGMFQIMGVLNLGYALLVAQLLFGDLYNSRMCNMLHAFPVSRECWFLTNCLSGLTFALIPYAVMMLVSAPLLMGSIFEGAAAMSFWLFLASMLQFICFFGMAAFAAMVTANRFTMVAGYGLLNGGAMIAYWFIDTVYTPMLYGVITPTKLMYSMTPAYHFYRQNYLETDAKMYELTKQFGNRLEGAVATYSLTDQWWRLWLLAGIGIIFALLALALYRKRHLECAGDAVAFPVLVPVFEVLCAITVTAVVQFGMEHILGLGEFKVVTLPMGLILGWFVGKMLIERSTRVFRLKNFYGLALLAAVFGVSLLLTKFDVLGIEDYRPEAAKVKKVYFETDWTTGRYLDSPEDIEAMLALHEDALENPAESSGLYVEGYDGTMVRYVDSNDHLYDKENQDLPWARVAEVGLRYELENGKIVRRRYNVWVDTEGGAIANDYLNDWAELNPTYQRDGVEYTRLERVMEAFFVFHVDDGSDTGVLPPICSDKDAAMELLQAMDLDMQEGHMAEHAYFHKGFFRYEEERAEKGYVDTESTYISISSKEESWSIQVYADAEHTIAWLQSHGFLPGWEIHEGTVRY